MTETGSSDSNSRERNGDVNVDDEVEVEEVGALSFEKGRKRAKPTKRERDLPPVVMGSSSICTYSFKLFILHIYYAMHFEVHFNY